MKLFSKILLVAILIASSVGWGQALVFQEDFSYTAGTSLVSNGWTVQTAGTPTINVSSSGLSYSGYIGSNVGLAASLPTTTGETVRKNLTSSQTSSVYISCLVNVSTATSSGGYFLVTRYNTSNHNRGRIWIKSDGASGFYFGVSKSSTGTPTYGITSYSLNTTYLVVLKYAFIGSLGTDDVLSLWVNPTSFGGAEDPSPLISNANDGTADLTNLGSIVLNQGIGGIGLIIDGIRASTSWATVLPTPPYYYDGSGDLTDVNNYGTEPDGSGSHPSNFTSNDQTFILQNTSSATLNSAWTVSGTNSKIIVGNGTNLIVGVGGSIFATVDVSAGGTYTITQSTLGSSSFPTFGVIIGEVHFNNPSGFTLSEHLALPSGNFVLASGNIDVGTYTLTVNGVIICGTNNIIGSGTFTLSAGASLRIGSPDGISSSGATGNIQTNVRNFNVGANYVYNGSGTNLITGTGLPSSINALTINLTSATDIITLTNSVTTTGSIYTFQRGRLKLGNNDISTSATTGGGGSADGYVITNGTGRIIRPQTNTSTTSKTFHVGNEMEYRKVVITFPTSTGVATANLNVQFIASNPGSVGYPSGIVNHYPGGYWVITMDIAPLNSYTIDVETAGITGLNNISTARILKRANNSVAWDFAGTAHSNTGTLKTETGCTGLSEFTIGGGNDNPLMAKVLTLTALIEGFYDGSNMVVDVAKVELHNATSPWGIVDTATVSLNSSGNGTVNFFTAADATNYYVVVKHRNSIETWSKSPQQFSSGSLSYNFTTAATQAYGDNMVLVGSKYCFFSGDVSDGATPGNQDGYIDIFDDFEVYNDSYSAIYRLLTDLNLDGYVDIFDDFYCYNNSYNGIYAQYPGFPRPGYLKKGTKKVDLKKVFE